VRGLADGFFVPLFFVVLGARLQLSALSEDPSILRLTVALVSLNNVAVHLVAARLTRQRVPAALIATAQLGVPAAVVTLGLQDKVLTAAQGAAIIIAALASLAIAALGPRSSPARPVRPSGGRRARGRPPGPSLRRRQPRTVDTHGAKARCDDRLGRRGAHTAMPRP
jgi:Kef-type K+ transport system membrane component KefB